MEFEDERLLREVLLFARSVDTKINDMSLEVIDFGDLRDYTKNEVLLTLYWLEENGFLIRNNNIAEKRYTLTLKGELLYDRFSQIEE
ncbi:DUF3116 domain-containing protein [Listeria monocytogenes]|uniref:DUF3116 family protein n=1 Tax=Listeria monocytogenes TaxID=1639 RepID=UPI0009878493|nr:DUF3116 family protein [Listeria monocytogenes]EAC9720366.1 DUF3116 domain-containing protein [Listeria monocytogenes]EAD0384077.1 DUF3116 domain-containing protein [Listeria monocytogenes]EAF2020948.1 DUF3116 domain-containing protein [Listeria monocytogenes]ECW7754837.1 DUF3116 domain-containing protein [Listeria monocytogenes]ECW8210254.1 DUF3116 domain-containing protein [Listeria monocytogenes]